MEPFVVMVVRVSLSVVSERERFTLVSVSTIRDRLYKESEFYPVEKKAAHIIRFYI